MCWCWALFNRLYSIGTYSYLRLADIYTSASYTPYIYAVYADFVYNVYNPRLALAARPQVRFHFFNVSLNKSRQDKDTQTFQSLMQWRPTKLWPVQGSAKNSIRCIYTYIYTYVHIRMYTPASLTHIPTVATALNRSILTWVPEQVDSQSLRNDLPSLSWSFAAAP